MGYHYLRAKCRLPCMDLRPIGTGTREPIVWNYLPYLGVSYYYIHNMIDIRLELGTLHHKYIDSDERGTAPLRIVSHPPNFIVKYIVLSYEFYQYILLFSLQ
jgi:hypothetical protein